jgi:hypothetical protein
MYSARGFLHLPQTNRENSLCFGCFLRSALKIHDEVGQTMCCHLSCCLLRLRIFFKQVSSTCRATQACREQPHSGLGDAQSGVLSMLPFDLNESNQVYQLWDTCVSCSLTSSKIVSATTYSLCTSTDQFVALLSFVRRARSSKSSLPPSQSAASSPSSFSSEEPPSLLVHPSTPPKTCFRSRRVPSRPPSPAPGAGCRVLRNPFLKSVATAWSH